MFIAKEKVFGCFDQRLTIKQKVGFSYLGDIIKVSLSEDPSLSLVNNFKSVAVSTSFDKPSNRAFPRRPRQPCQHY